MTSFVSIFAFSYVYIFLSEIEQEDFEYLEEIGSTTGIATTATVMFEVKPMSDGCSFQYLVSEETPAVSPVENDEHLLKRFEPAKKKRKIPPHMRPRTKSETRFECPKCGKEYSLAKNMRRHARLECNQEPKFSCPHCPLRCKRNNQLQRHILARHENM